MTIYSKSRGSDVCQFLRCSFIKILKVMFHRGTVTKYVVSMVNCLYFINVCLYHHNGITQKPHEYLFQKSGKRGLPVLRCKYSKFKNMVFQQGIVTEYVVSMVNCLYFINVYVYQHNGITQKPHDHSFQKSGKRGLPVFAL